MREAKSKLEAETGEFGLRPHPNNPQDQSPFVREARTR